MSLKENAKDCSDVSKDSGDLGWWPRTWTKGEECSLCGGDGQGSQWRRGWDVDFFQGSPVYVFSGKKPLTFVLYINRSTNCCKSHAHERVLAKLMLERMGDYTKGRDRARALSRVDGRWSASVLCIALFSASWPPWRSSWHPRQGGWDNVFLLDSYVFSGEAISNKAFDDHIFA